MNLGENRIRMRILRLTRSPAVPVFRIPEPFLIEFITASRRATAHESLVGEPNNLPAPQPERRDGFRPAGLVCYSERMVGILRLGGVCTSH